MKLTRKQIDALSEVCFECGHKFDEGDMDGGRCEDCDTMIASATGKEIANEFKALPLVKQAMLMKAIGCSIGTGLGAVSEMELDQWEDALGGGGSVNSSLAYKAMKQMIVEIRRLRTVLREDGYDDAVVYGEGE